MTTTLPEAPTLPATEAELPPLPEGWVIPEDADDAGKLCMVQHGVGVLPPKEDPAEGERCTKWAVNLLIGFCSACFKPVATYACQSCTDITIQLTVKHPQAMITGCCGGYFMLGEVRAL